MNKKGFEMSFSFIFAIIVGGFILFLAIFAISKFSSNQIQTQDVKTMKSIEVLANSFELGYENSTITQIQLPSDSRIYSYCNNLGSFGEQELILRSKYYDKWSERGSGIISKNKYFFFEEPLQSKSIIVFSKPFDFPFKVATLNYFIPSSQEYCFMDPPTWIKEELEKTQLSNFVIDDCQSNSIKICFEEDKDICNVIVYLKENYVEKDSQRYYFSGTALMFAGIFSEKEQYECQVKRLMQRTDSLTDLYLGKINFDLAQGCSANQQIDLIELKNFVSTLEDSYDLTKAPDFKNMLNKNSRSPCPTW